MPASSPIAWADECATASVKQVAARLGMSASTFNSKRADMEDTTGFPRPDRVLNRYIKADVDAWIARRRQISDTVATSSTTESPPPRINSEQL